MVILQFYGANLERIEQPIHSPIQTKSFYTLVRGDGGNLFDFLNGAEIFSDKKIICLDGIKIRRELSKINSLQIGN